jgi:hypothetical protein
MPAATKLLLLESEPKSRSATSEVIHSAYAQAVALYDACVRHARVRTATPVAPARRASASNESKIQVGPLNDDIPYDDIPCDFLAYLESRLGTDRDATTEMLSEWLAAYEPQRRSGAARAVGI